MTARLLDGKDLARRIQQGLRARIAELPRPPGLSVILVGADPGSQVYVRRKGEVAHRLGLRHEQIDLPANISAADLAKQIRRLGDDDAVDGILVQLPLPSGLDPQAAVAHIDPTKDADGLTTTSAGLLAQGRLGLRPCTPAGVMALLADANVPLRGARALVIGRSLIVGRPMAQMLEQADATVTVAHSRTIDLAAEARRADIIVAAIGRPRFVTGDMIRDGAVVIDVGMNRGADGSLCGDVDFDAAALRASMITPVPGGVGPLTIAGLMANTVTASEARQRR